MEPSEPSVSDAIHPGWHAVEALRVFGGHPFTFAAIAAFGLMPTAGYYLLSATWIATTAFQVPIILVADEVIDAALIYAAASFAPRAAIPAADVLQAYREALTRIRGIVEVFIRQLGAALLLAITVVGIPWAIGLYVRWHFAVYGVMLEGMSPKAAISFSCDLVNGRWWRIFGLLIATTAPGAIIGTLFAFANHSLALDLTYTVTYSLVAWPLITIFWALLFLHLRAAYPERQTEPLPAT